jgi:hypothetical protein
MRKLLAKPFSSNGQAVLVAIVGMAHTDTGELIIKLDEGDTATTGSFYTIDVNRRSQSMNDFINKFRAATRADVPF